MSNELKVTKERVLAAAEGCSTAKDVLSKLFPEAFEKKEKWEDVTRDAYLEVWRDSELLICVTRVDEPVMRDFITINDNGTWQPDIKNTLKIEKGRIWRKK